MAQGPPVPSLGLDVRHLAADLEPVTLVRPHTDRGRLLGADAPKPHGCFLRPRPRWLLEGGSMCV